ncbi:hypothetical protein PFCIP103579_1530 [Prolinoborus fasciculus]|nr:hypothetical protein [Prolinoborus fasciculus]SPJ20386.1 hypothetical protein PFCIP103579_1530 [Prolinoborus fasciculus]
MNMQIDFKRHSKSQFLNPEQIEEFGAKVDAIRREVMDDLGEKDAEYIYKIRNFVRYSEIASRGMLMFAGWLPPVWLAGTGLLGLSKIGGVSKSMLKKSRLDFDKIEKCE